VHAVSGLLFQAGCNIIDSQQFGDLIGPGATGRFFMRVHFEAPPQLADVATLDRMLSNVTQQFEMDSQLHALARRPRVLLMVSQHGHCLNDLLFRWHSGQLDIDIPAIVSNHTTFADLAPATACRSTTCRSRPAPRRRPSASRSRRCRRSWSEAAVDLVVLARYMQILSPELCGALENRAINIHHSFLPSFKGAKPYYQAHDRGVKLIGATAHYVTADLDEGPIIEQDVERVDHTLTPEDITAIGRDVELGHGLREQPGGQLDHHPDVHPARRSVGPADGLGHVVGVYPAFEGAVHEGVPHRELERPVVDHDVPGAWAVGGLGQGGGLHQGPGLLAPERAHRVGAAAALGVQQPVGALHQVDPGRLCGVGDGARRVRDRVVQAERAGEDAVHGGQVGQHLGRTPLQLAAVPGQLGAFDPVGVAEVAQQRVQPGGLGDVRGGVVGDLDLGGSDRQRPGQDLGAQVRGGIERFVGGEPARGVAQPSGLVGQEGQSARCFSIHAVSAAGQAFSAQAPSSPRMVSWSGWAGSNCSGSPGSPGRRGPVMGCTPWRGRWRGVGGRGASGAWRWRR
jgi:formyltetrahydrofolate deformylase